MTVSYMQEAATANSFTFLRLLFRWRGSVWKSVAFELFVWLFIYFNFSTIYVFFLRDSKSGNIYEQVVKRCQQIVPEGRTVVTFALGFYVSHITNRWWTIFMTIPWPDTTALALCAFLRTRSKKHEVEDKAIRKSILRYMLLSFVLVFRDVSERIIKRFPTYKHLVPALMTEEERLKLERIEKVRVHWMPIEWSLSLLRRCREQGSIDEHHFCTVTRKVLDYRQMLHNILSFDWVNVPLVYVQVVNLCTMSYFFLQLLATQPILDEKQNQQVDIVPVYFIMEFIVFNGWLKTAQVMLNPFGMDDDDFEVDALIERNMMISYSYVEDLFDKAPRLVDIEVTKLPHTMASAALMGKANPMIGSAANIKIKKADQRQLNKDNFQKITNFMKHPIASSTRSVEGISTLPFDNHETSQKKFATPTSSARDEKDDPRKIAFDLDEAIEKLTKLRESQFADQMPSMNSKPPSRHRDLDLMSAKTQTPSLVAEKPEEKTKRSKKMNLDKIAPPVNETAHSAANSAAVSRQAAQPDRRTDKDVKKEIRVLVEKFLRNENVKIETAPSRSMNKISTESTRRPLTTPIATTVASAENSVRVQKIVRPDFDPNLDETQKDDIP